MATIAYRPAALGDAGDILKLLLDLAADIPLLVDTLEREEALYAAIRLYARSGESWVACDEISGNIVGVALAERAQQGRHYAEHEVVELRYATARSTGILAALLDHICSGMVPVVATVSPNNRTGLAACLEAAGFHPTGAPVGERLYRWQAGR